MAATLSGIKLSKHKLLHTFALCHLQNTNPLVLPAAAEDPPQSFAAYLRAELHPGPSYPTADVVWGQTERDRVCVLATGPLALITCAL